jgi:hypothetical protein
VVVPARLGGLPVRAGWAAPQTALLAAPSARSTSARMAQGENFRMYWPKGRGFYFCPANFLKRKKFYIGNKTVLKKVLFCKMHGNVNEYCECAKKVKLNFPKCSVGSWYWILRILADL